MDLPVAIHLKSQDLSHESEAVDSRIDTGSMTLPPPTST